jgi:hypothetical protein
VLSRISSRLSFGIPIRTVEKETIPPVVVGIPAEAMAEEQAEQVVQGRDPL